MPDMRSEKNSQAADSESMQAQSTYRNVIGSQEWLIGGGQMGDRIRAMDWAATPLGPRHSWLQSLRTTVNLILSTQFPMCILWGDALIMIYNEGYRIIAAGKDPAALGRSSREVWPEVWEFNKPIFEKVMINRETVYLENQIYTIARKGHAEQACFTICYSPIYDESGKVAGTLVTLVETTRQIQREKRSEEALKSSEEKYRSLFNSIDEGFFLIDVIFDQNDKPVDLLYVEANPAATRIVGCDYTGRHLTEIDPNYETYWFEIFGDVAKTGRSVRMERYAAPDKKWYSFYVFKFGGPESRRIANTFQDITERKSAEAQVSQSQRTFSELLERAPFGIYIVDSQFRIAHMNAGSQNGAFRNVRPVIGRDFAEAMRILWPEPVATEIISEFRHTLDTGEPYYSPRFFNPRHDVEAVEGYEWELHRMTLPDGQYGVVCYYFDSTKLRESEEAVRSSEKKYRQLFNSMTEGFLLVEPIFDESGKPVSYRYLDANPALAKLTHLKPENIIGKDVREVLPNVEPHWIETFARVALTGKAERIEEFSKDLNGWYDVQIYCPETGKAALIYTNTTERRQAEAQRERLLSAVQEERDKLTALINSIPEEVWFADSNGKFTLANPSALNEFALKESNGAVDVLQLAQELEVYRSDGTLRPAEEAPPLLALNGETVKNHEELIRTPATGELRYRQVNSNPVRDAEGRIIGSVSVVRDVTERKQAEESLRLRSERLTLLSKAASHLLRAQDPDAMVHDLFDQVSAHLKVHAYFNFMVDEHSGGLRLESYTGIPSKAARLIRRLELGQAICGTVAQTRQRCHATFVQTSNDPKAELIRRYGIRAYCCHPLMSGTRLLGTLSFGSRAVDRFSDDEIEFMQTICHYVAIAKERLRLERELRERIEQLAVADRRKDEFLAMLAHELRNPLAAISSANELLRLRGSTEPMIKRARDAAARQTAHMARLLDDLLDVSRVTQGKITLNKEDVPVLSFLESAIEASNPFMNARNHQLYVSHPREPMRVHGDRVRLSQAIGNLLHNAAKYTPPGGKVYLVTQRDRDQALISVQDNGNGIDPELLPHAFELFVQGSRSPDRAEGGLGIGLTLTKSIIELHNGRVEASSEGPGRGSEFRIWLPLLPTPEKQIGATESAKGEKVRSLRIMVVDDNVDSAELLSALLGIEGHEVSVANSGLSAIELALKDPPDVALLDIGMPGMDGYEVARRMRGSELLKGMKLIAVSGYGQQEDLQKSREAGFDEHLVKPVDLETLGRVLKKIAEHA